METWHWYGLLSLIVGVVISLTTLGIILWLGMRGDDKRREAAAKAAEALGFTFTAEVPAQHLRPYSDLWLFQQGDWRFAANLMEGTYNGVPVRLMEVQYATRSRYHDQRRTGARRVLELAVFPKPNVILPDFQLLPRTLSDQIGDALLGREDMALEGGEAAEQFSKHYWLSGPDREGIKRVFSARVVAYFAENPGLRLEASEGHLYIWTPWGSPSAAPQAQAYAAFLNHAGHTLKFLSAG